MKKTLLIILATLMFANTEVLAVTGYTFNVTVALDSTAPTTQNDYDGLWHNADFTINLTATDAGGVKDTYYKINGGSMLAVSTAGQPVISTEGANNIMEYWSVDKSGNEETPHKTLSSIKLDKTPPVVSITSPANEAAFNQGPITITGTATDALSGLNSVSVNVEGTVYTSTVSTDGSFSITGITIVGGPNKVTASGVDIAGNTGNISISVFLGWVLHMQVPYQSVTSYGSAAASSQMILNYIRNGLADPLTQDTIYNYGHQYNDPLNATLQEMDPKAVSYALGHFDPYDLTDPDGYGDPYRGYNFDAEAFDNTKFTDYLRDVIHWMAYPVTIDCWWKAGDLVKWPNTPPAVPAYGTYNHWIIVNGAATTENPIPQPHTNPWYTPNFTAYGLWLTDPATGGIGQDVYVTAQSAQETFFLPMITSDAYNGKYVLVAEPPIVESTATVSVAPPNVNDQTLQIAKISDTMSKEVPSNLSDAEQTVENAQKHLYDAALVVNLKNDVTSGSSTQSTYSLNSLFDTSQSHPQLDWKKIIDPSLLTDDNFVKAFDGSQATNFVKVRRADKDNDFYYLIPFDKYVNGQFLTYAAIIINAQDGSFKEASWVDKPTRFIQVTKDDAIQLVLSANPALQSASITAELVWQPSGPSQSPFYPYWQVTSGDLIYFVTQNSEVIAKDAQTQ